MLHIIPIEEKTGGTDMNILFYDTKRYDMESFDAIKDQYDKLTIDYVDTDLSVKTARLAKGYDAICAFVSSDVSAPVVNALSDAGVKLILMRCAGFNNVDMDAAKKCGITVMRVPGYSPEAVAEHAMALAMAVNRRLHKSYIKVRENNFSLVGLTGMNFYGKTAGIVGTGKIGAAMARICHGFGMDVIAYDMYKNPDLDFVRYVMSIDPKLKMNTYNKGKYLLRHAFEDDDYLPYDILFREKAAFSDAVGHSMVDYIKEYANGLYSDEEYEEKRKADMIVDFWMPNKNWENCDVNDPSARVLKNYGQSGC